MENQIASFDIQIELYGETISVQCKPEQTILEAMLIADIDPPYSCKMGACGACRAKLIAGQVQMEDAVSLTDEEVAQGYFLSCQAIPISPACTIIFD